MNDFNTRCEQFKQKLIKEINESNLPISSVYFIYQLIFLDLEKTYYATLNSEAQEVEDKEDDIKE